MLDFLIRFFTWWNGQTFGTQYYTSKYGELVGHDDEGNAYYRTKGGKIDPGIGVQRRWVIYNGTSEASRIPPGWHGWMHHRTDTPPTKESYAPREWEIAHEGNPTGSAKAYRPQGSILGNPAAGKPEPVRGEYSAWTP